VFTKTNVGAAERVIVGEGAEVPPPPPQEANIKEQIITKFFFMRHKNYH
jgi:hypothetical protein